MSIKKVTILIFVFSTLVLNSIIAETKKAMPIADKKSSELWEKHIHNNPVRILDDWELCEPLNLCKQGGKIDNKLAVFATIAFADSPKTSVCDFVLNEKQFINYAQDLKGTALTEDEQEKIKTLFSKAKEKYGGRTMPVRYGTFFMGKALTLGLTINGESWAKGLKALISKDKQVDWIKNAVKQIGQIHGWYATVEAGKNIPFEKYKESVDKHIPVIVEENGYYKLIVGYINSKDKKYIVVVDLAKTPMEKTGMCYPPDQRETFESLPPNDPWRIMYEQRKNKKRFATDLQIRSQMPLPIGITIEEFNPGKYHAYFVYNWRKSMDAWKPEIEKIVKN